MRPLTLLFLLLTPTFTSADPSDPYRGFGAQFAWDHMGTVGSEARAGAYYSDGRILLAGRSENGSNNDFALLRYWPDGTLDTSFGSLGKIIQDLNGKDDVVHAVAIDDSNRVIAAGKSYIGGGYDFAVLRYDTNGVLDTKFGSGGRVFTDFGLGDIARGVAIDSLKRIVVAGYRDVTPGLGQDLDFAVARYETNGILDTKFGSSGLVTTPVVAAQHDSAHAVNLLTDNRIMLVGRTGSSTLTDFAVVRYETNGALDTNFGSAGIATSNFSSKEDWAWGAAFESLGRLTVVGRAKVGTATHYDFALARYSTDGILDTKFSGDGLANSTVIANQDDIARGIVFISAEMTVAGLTFNGSNIDIALARYRSNGNLYTPYGSSGRTVYDFNLDEKALGIIEKNGGFYHVFGGYHNGSYQDFIAYHEHKSGRASDLFDYGSNTDTGASVINMGSGGESISYAVQQDDGKIVVGGLRQNDPAGTVARMINNGKLDTNFGSAGVVFTDFTGGGNGGNTNGLHMRADQKILVAGQAGNIGSYVALMRSNGLLDTNYASDGLFLLNYESNGTYTGGSYFRSNFLYVHAGTGGGKSIVYKLNSDGKLDTNFGSTTGVAASPFASIAWSHRIVLDSNNKIYTQNHTNLFWVFRYNADGSIDTDWGSDQGRVENGGTTTSGLALDSQNRVYVGGIYSVPQDVLSVERYRTDGVLDSSFDADGVQYKDYGAGEIDSDVFVMRNNKIIVSASAGGVCRYRLLPDGSFDTEFSDDVSGVNRDAWNLATDIVWGTFQLKDGMIATVGSTGNETDSAIQMVFP